MYACLFIWAAVFISACATSIDQQKQAVVRVPYLFQIGSFTDAREKQESLNEELGAREDWPFERETFQQMLVTSLNQGLFVSDPARLDITLLDYAALQQQDGKRVISMYMDLTGQNKTGDTLADGRFSCAVEGKQHFDFAGSLKSTFQTSGYADTSHSTAFWQRIMRQCLAEIAYHFNNKIAGAQRSLKK